MIDKSHYENAYHSVSDTISVLNGSRSCTARTRLSRVLQTPTHQRLLKSLKIHARTLNVLFAQHTAELAVLERIYDIISNQNRPAACRRSAALFPPSSIP